MNSDTIKNWPSFTEGLWLREIAYRGGWTRQDPNHWDGSPVWRNQYLNTENHDDESLIFVINKETGAVDTQPLMIKHIETPVIDGMMATCNDCASSMFGQCDRHRPGGTGF